MTRADLRREWVQALDHHLGILTDPRLAACHLDPQWRAAHEEPVRMLRLHLQQLDALSLEVDQALADLSLRSLSPQEVERLNAR